MKRVKCIFNENCNEYFSIDNIYEAEDYNENSYIITIPKNNSLIKVKVPITYFTEINESEELIEINQPNYIFDTIKKMRYDSLLITTSYLNNLSESVSYLLLNKIKPEELPEKIAKVMIGIDILNSCINIPDEFIYNEKLKLISEMENLLKENKVPIL